MRYAVVIESAGSNFSAYVPELATAMAAISLWFRVPALQSRLPGLSLGQFRIDR